MSVQKQMLADGYVRKDESGEPQAIAQTGIGFPSNDGFHIQIDFSAVWGAMPKDAPKPLAAAKLIPNMNLPRDCPRTSSCNCSMRAKGRCGLISKAFNPRCR